MINYSKPKFISVEDQLSMQKDETKTTACCRCPLPIAVEIDGVLGGYYHVVEYEKRYVCEDCGTEFSVGRYFDPFDPAKDYNFNKEKTEEYLKNAEKELNEEFNKILQEKGAVTIIEIGKLVDRIICGMSEEDIRRKYDYFDYFGIG